MRVCARMRVCAQVRVCARARECFFPVSEILQGLSFVYPRCLNPSSPCTALFLGSKGHTY